MKWPLLNQKLMLLQKLIIVYQNRGFWKTIPKIFYPSLQSAVSPLIWRRERIREPHLVDERERNFCIYGHEAENTPIMWVLYRSTWEKWGGIIRTYRYRGREMLSGTLGAVAVSPGLGEIVWGDLNMIFFISIFQPLWSFFGGDQWRLSGALYWHINHLGSQFSSNRNVHGSPTQYVYRLGGFLSPGDF